MDFERMVGEDWRRAVARAVGLFPANREAMLSALRSSFPQVRSAAIAVFIEADDCSVHDEVLPLLDDRDEDVRNEALEYLVEFARRDDACLLLSVLREGGHPFLTTTALCTSLGWDGPILDDEDTPEDVAAAIAAWEQALKVRSAGAAGAR